jgi:hypothetical protein
MFIFTRDAYRGASRLVSASGISAFAWLCMSCAALDSGNDSCLNTPDCIGVLTNPLEPDAGPSISGDWACLDKAAPATPPQGQTVNYQLPIVDWVGGSRVTGTPIKRLMIYKCAAVDGQCSTPLVPSPWMPSDERTDKNVTVPLEAGFNGFLKLVSTDGVMPGPNGMLDTSMAYVPETYNFGDTVYAPRTVETIIQMIKTPILVQVAQNIGVNVDFTQALLVLRVLDCAGKPAAGVRFEISTNGQPGQPYTFINGLPRLPMGGSKFVPTDNDGQAGFANVTPGYVFVDAYIDANNRKINRTSVSATALPAQITTIEVHAQPYGILP